MPGPLLHLGATVTCAHLGQAQPTSVNARVLVSGQPIATMTSTYSIMGCTFPSISAGAPPCATAQWVRGATRVLAAVRADPWLLAAIGGVLVHELVEFDLQIPALAAVTVVLSAARAHAKWTAPGQADIRSMS